MISGMVTAVCLAVGALFDVQIIGMDNPGAHVFFGQADGDGCADKVAHCPTQPEDVDGFEDDDCCPDPDNDKDGLADVQDRCPNIPEDKDGWNDEDGCPELDNDSDGIADQIDQLPAGGGAAEAVLVILLVFFLVLVILDLTGVTDVFPFIKSQK